MKWWRHIGLLLLFVSMTSGCATMKAYEGPELPPDEVAIIRYQYFWRSLVRIEVVDGKMAGYWDYYFAVKPGEHTLGMIVRKCYTSYDPTSFTLSSTFCSYFGGANVVLRFKADAGHTYVVRSFWSKNTQYWVEDEDSEQVVAGRKPE